MSDIRVFVIDDSALIRKTFSEGLSKIPGIKVIGTAIDPYHARDQIIELKPDVITLDIEMPRMDGLTFLGKIMTYFPTPTIIVSSVSPKNSANAIRAMELGAIDVLCKPTAQSGGMALLMELGRKIKIASTIDITTYKNTIANNTLSPSTKKYIITTTDKIIAIGSSTGGTLALRKILPHFPKNSPCIMVVQHMPAGFTKSFADALNDACVCDVKEAEEGDIIANGKIYIAPGDFHMVLNKSGARYSVGLNKGPAVCYQRPAADVLFQSVAKNAGKNAIGVILTGMGNDGTSGLLSMKKEGAKIVGQDEASSVVYGMPRSAFNAGAVEKQVPLDKVPETVLGWCS
ncbi:MAG: chemotaxis response regulator protein-glutamate methylesterase [Candidatus Riflemargulisbacteria bacterium]